MPQIIPLANFENFNVVIIRPGVSFAKTTGNFIWNENSPLPPGMRYMELADFYVEIAGGSSGFPSPENTYITGLDDSILPKDSAGNIRRNLKWCEVDVSGFNLVRLTSLPSLSAIQSLLDVSYADDSKWTGEVVDPVQWIDDWWDALLINRVEMAAYLEAHPGCKLNA